MPMQCQQCGSHEAETTVQYCGNDQQWCPLCTRRYSCMCHDCEDVRVCNNGTVGTCNTDGDAVCVDCGDSYFSCEDCGERYHVDDRCRENSNRCTDCGDQVIDRYDLRVDLPPLGRGPHYFGVELEVECMGEGRRSASTSARDSLALLGSDFAIAKSDGSLNSGFELVSVPASLDVQLKRWEPFFNGRPKDLRSHRTDTCGLHVHTSRAPLSELTIAKVVCFTNAAHNRKFVHTIAGRSNASWARFKHKKLCDGNKTNPSRYESVNLQNEHTIEFRIFKGTLKKESFYKAIEFVDALVRYCAPCERSLRDAMSRTIFCDYVSKNHKRWPHLDAFIKARWLGQSTKLTEKYGFKATEVNNEQENEE